WRTGDKLLELHASDLRFTAGEAAVLLNQALGLDLAPVDIATLTQRTEGWAAGLQLAGLSLQGRTDTHDFIAAFTGTHRYIADYLTEEVLQRQPEPVQAFLLQTSILGRLCAPLAQAVIGGDDQQPDTAGQAPPLHP